MPAEEDMRALLLQRLIQTFGQDRVLSDSEDLYVYSRRSRLGTRHLVDALAVLRVKAEGDEARLRRIAEPLGISVYETHDESVRTALPSGPVVIADNGRRVTFESLPGKLAALLDAKTARNRELKVATSLPESFLAALRNTPGYRIEDVEDSNEGFCALEPLIDGRETTSAKGRLVLSRGLMTGDIKASPKLADAMYGCSVCGQCYDHITLEGFEVNNAIVRARREVVAQGMEPTQCKFLRSNISGSGNPFGLPPEDRDLWFEELVEDHPYHKGDLLYWTGCSTAYRLPEVVRATSSVLEKAGVGFGLLGSEEGCCGLILYLLGLWNEATRNASSIVEKLTAFGTKELVTSCAGCYYTFTRVYRKLGVEPPFSVRHTSQVIESLIKEGKLELRGFDGSYVWHDPCDLGRHCGVYDPPRRVLGAVPRLRLVEQKLARRHTLCCGGGGGMWTTNTDLAERAARMKLDQFSALGVDGVVTGCPNCILIMRYMAGPDGAKKILDLSEVVDGCSLGN